MATNCSPRRKFSRPKNFSASPTSALTNSLTATPRGPAPPALSSAATFQRSMAACSPTAWSYRHLILRTEPTTGELTPGSTAAAKPLVKSISSGIACATPATFSPATPSFFTFTAATAMPAPLLYEVDLFEALADVEKNFQVDENRIFDRGFSMGGASSWHIGAHYGTYFSPPSPPALASSKPWNTPARRRRASS